MEKKTLTDLFITAAGQLLYVIIALNLLSLIFELLLLKNFDNYNLTFKHGYFVLNERQIGINIFANVFAFIILAIIQTMYLANKQKTQEQRNLTCP